MRIGVSKVNITPTKPLKLGGFDFRTDKYERIGYHVYARCFVLNNKNAIVSLELLFVGEYLNSLIKKQIEADQQLSHLSVTLTATHTHSSFQTSSDHSPKLGEFNVDYCNFIADKVIIGIKKAIDNLTDVTIEEADSQCDMAIYRRVVNSDRTVLMAPNYDEYIDKKVKLLKFVNEEGTTQAVLLHGQCHPTISGDNILSGEYPGVVCDELEKAYPLSVCLYLQGFCGDIRPNLINDGKFYRGSYSDIIELGKKIAIQYLNALNKSQKIETDDVEYFNQKSVELPFSRLMNENELVEFKSKFKPTEIYWEWANHQLSQIQEGKDQTENNKATISYLNIGNVIKLLTINAEVVNAYQQYISKYIDKDILCVGYSNGMLGYIPTKKQIEEGGYEPNDSAYYFYLKSTLLPDVENSLKIQFKNLILESK
ncbi:neutral/alkaline non-lysosomal ceramidase N-terminal domain-containing protein [Vibrio sp. SS-MA-C1-2]|uniref:neutral/alkaline non-lysosomal ceramidase N-terminal domain-containing protein n=1 Tax=Vibrio sp. SS-MA-C1-2 TaxID=2908646 RepID=UPI001F3EF50A|nr:neutral/alkaline non-lysosomal ceramidase N-terminal domain-containing protein [Vibrio sp. SS-MA-C1-2]UJF18272.1 neutral/alkaline non-lysosomal ceramidase N-terminal domain-containing protein [Vibrio sp. SS-MA-C1-2]